MTASDLVGRDRELAMMESLLGGLATVGHALLFVGDAGAGKSALLDVAAERAADAGYLVVRVDGVEFEAEIGFSALSQAVLPLQHFLPGLEALHRDALLVALGLRQGETPDRLVVATAALRLLHLAGEAAPVLLLVDDLHWIDRASCEAFLFLARRVHGSRLGFLAAARPDAGVRLGNLTIEECELPSLDDSAAHDLLRARFPMLTPRARDRLVEEAQGNPLALLELPPALSGPRRGTHDALPETLPLTERLQSLFATRIKPLAAPARDLLLLASLDGTGDWNVLRAASGDPALAQLAPAEDAGLLTLSDDDHRLVFRHPLTRSAVVALATPAERRDAHRRLGDALTGYPDRQAWHFGEAAIAPDARIADLLEHAARRAVARGDSDAVAWLFKAADLSPNRSDRSRRLTEAAYLGAFRTGDDGTLSPLFASVRDLEPGTDEALYAVATAVYFMLIGDGDVDTAFRLLRDTIESVTPVKRDDVMALTTALDVIVQVCVLAACPDYSDDYQRLLARLEPIVSPRFRLSASALLDPVRTVRPELDDIDAAIATINEVEDPVEVLGLAGTAVYTDRLARVRPALERVAGSDAGEVSMQVVMSAKGLAWVAQFRAGEWAEARATSRAARQLDDHHERLLWALHFAHLDGLMAALTGDDDTVARSTERLLATADAQNARLWRLYARHILVFAAASHADFDAVYRHATAIGSAGTFPEQSPIALWVFFELVDAAVRTGRLIEARRHVAAAQQLHVAEISPRLAMFVAAAEGLVTADPTTAGEQFARAVGRDELETWPFDRARYGSRTESTFDAIGPTRTRDGSSSWRRPRSPTWGPSRGFLGPTANCTSSINAYQARWRSTRG